jgi:hypothetical protein
LRKFEIYTDIGAKGCLNALLNSLKSISREWSVRHNSRFNEIEAFLNELKLFYPFDPENRIGKSAPDEIAFPGLEAVQESAFNPVHDRQGSSARTIARSAPRTEILCVITYKGHGKIIQIRNNNSACFAKLRRLPACNDLNPVIFHAGMQAAVALALAGYSAQFSRAVPVKDFAAENFFNAVPLCGEQDFG